MQRSSGSVAAGSSGSSRSFWKREEVRSSESKETWPKWRVRFPAGEACIATAAGSADEEEEDLVAVGLRRGLDLGVLLLPFFIIDERERRLDFARGVYLLYYIYKFISFLGDWNLDGLKD